MLTPQETWERAKEDPEFSQRLLDYISQVVEECMPEDIDPLEEDEDESRLFEPSTHPNRPDFKRSMCKSILNVVRYSQIHKGTHMPTCFKYGSKKCRSRFPRAIVAVTSFNKDTGVFRIKRNHRWVNNYHKWIGQMTRGNHDVQFLFTNKHALAIINYVMKYITKAEVALHSKLTIAAAVRKALADSSPPADVGKKMLLKIYNKIESYREVGVPEAITHLLGYPDHYTDGVFCNLHTTHLLFYIRRLESLRKRRTDDTSDGTPDSKIVIDDNGGFSLVSPFDDYANRGESLSDYCLYDYYVLVYKKRGRQGISFESEHTLHLTNHQIVRATTAAIPTLLGKLLFLNKDSEESSKREDYYCILASLFFPWSRSQPVKSDDTVSWEEFFLLNSISLIPRLRWYIANIDLLHKTKEEDRLNRLQLLAQQAEPDGDSHSQASDSDIVDRMEIQFDDGACEDVPHSAAVDQAIETLTDVNSDFYIREGIDASETQGYLNPPTFLNAPDENDQIHYWPLPAEDVMDARASLSAAASGLQATSISVPDSHLMEDVLPDVYLTDGTEDEAAVQHIVVEFTLNTEQARAFRIVADHTLGKSKFGNQLLVGLFGEAGTGKSRIVNAICAWFASRNRSHELIVTATTGMAAFNIRGETLHSALGIAVEREQKNIKMSQKKKKDWANRRYLIIDEVSMLDCKMMIKLHNKLCSANSSKDDVILGGFNILFFGDFLQLPSISPYHLYTANSPYHLGHHLWRSLNAVVILTEQMRQAGDPRYAQLLHLRIRQPTAEDIQLLLGRIGARLNSSDVTIVVRRNELRHALNIRMLQRDARSRNIPITYCIAKDEERIGIPRSKFYRLRLGHNNVKGDAILPLIPGAPLMVSDNVDKPLGYSHLMFRFGNIL
jgi:PIF1-like helicase